MKRILLIAVGGLTASVAMGQGFSGEWYVKGSDKLHTKVWHSPGYSRADSYIDDNSEGTVMIFDHKAMKAWVIDHVQKTIIVMDDLERLSTNRLLGYDIEVADSKSREFHGIEDVEGRECMHYEVTTSTVYKGGSTDEYSRHYWVYEPLKSSFYNGNIQEDDPLYGMLVMRNIRMGPQPASLFEVPTGYQTMALPAGGLIELITGKSRDQNTQDIDNTFESLGAQFQELQKKMEEAEKSGSQEELLNSLMEMFK